MVLKNFIKYQIKNIIKIIIYSNAETDKLTILSITKQEAGIYLWTYKESGKIYIDFLINLFKQLKNYYNKNYLNRYKFIYIYKIIFFHNY